MALPRLKCCKNDKPQIQLNTLITYGIKYVDKLSLTPLPDKEEYTTLAQVKTINPYTQHYNKNLSNAPLDFDTKVTVRYTLDTAKIQNDWYVLIHNHRLRVKSVENIDKQNKYLILFLKTEQKTI